MAQTKLAAALALLALASCKTSSPPAGQAGAPEGKSPAAAARVPAQATAPAPAVPGIDPAILDATVKPCDDFYRYACGGWMARTPIPPDRSRWNRSFSVIEESNLVRLREIAEADAAGKVDPADRYGAKVGAYYAACMDEAGIEARGVEHLQAAWAHIDAAADVPALAVQVARLHAHGVSAFFSIGSEQDAKDATQVIGVVEQGGLSLPDRDYYLKDDPKSAAIQQSYREHLARMLVLAGEDGPRAGCEAEAVYALERSLAESHWTRVEQRDPKRVYNRVDLVGLERAAPRFPWKDYLRDLGYPDLTAFNATTPRALTRLDEVLAKTPPATIRAYLRWKVLAAASTARALPRRFFDERFAFSSKNFTGAKEPVARWKGCVRATDEALGEALGQAFVRRYFGADGKVKSQELVAGVEAAMGKDLDGLAWMDGPTRGRAREKLAKVANKVGYPDRWRDYDALTLDRSSYFASVLAARAFEQHRQLAKIGKPLDRNEWEMSPPTVNAYYDGSMNEMAFPAGILQPPMYARGAPEAVNYGAIGVVVGHELTHGFDDQGRQYDAVGNLTDWWTPSVSAEFDRRVSCVADQFSGYTAVDEVKLNGRLTLGENIADLGGVKLSHAAYAASRKGKPPEAPVAGFSPEQAFFLGFAQAWCESTRPEQARMYAAVDPHSPGRWRVNGPLSNLPEFAKAFSCPAGSAMVRPPEKRCEVW